MKHVACVPAALVLVCPALLANDRPAATGETVPVVVDPLDLRRPVPDPERELTLKYDGQVVRFTGVVHAQGQDARHARYYDLRADVTPAVARPQAGTSGRGTPQSAPAQRQTVDVRVYFQTDDARLRQPQTPQTPLTVEGRGNILHDGSLVIYGARILPAAAPVTR
jgi:hypothetical protein